MSSFSDAAWLRRLWSLARPGAPTTEHVVNVNVVNDGTFRGSREKAPFAQHSTGVLAAGAGVHNFFEIGGVDALGATLNLLHFARLLGGTTNQLTGVFRWVVADGASLTTATRVATTPLFRDADPDVTPVLFVGTIASANIPATAETLPKHNHIGETNASPLFDLCVTDVEKLAGLPFCTSWLGPRNLIFFGGANEINVIRLAWQCIRS